LWRTLTPPGIFRIMRGKSSPVMALILCAACSSNPVSPGIGELPAVIRECETHTARVCGTWTLKAGTSNYSATWPQGSTATITALRWTDDIIELERHDTGGPTPSMYARYLGMRHNNSVSFGQVRWINDGLTIFGTWDASW
jgi:hypothetical protein